MDQIVVLHDVSWKMYEAVVEARGESSGVRLAYLDGDLEIMSPSREHELIKMMFDKLLTAWAEETDTELCAVGSWTLRREGQKRGLEADQSYSLGSRAPKIPDLAVEVIWTPARLNKLEIYRGLGVSEVWFWREGVIEVHHLRRGGYVHLKRSALLPDLDLRLLAKYLRRPDQIQALKEYRAALRRNLQLS